jgi:hypothetical protein
MTTTQEIAMNVTPIRIGLIGLAALYLSVTYAFAGAWKPYFNPRFGTIVDAPTEGFTASPPAASGDGQEWVSDDGSGQVLVYGTLIVTVDTFWQYRDYITDLARSDGLDITYAPGKGNWFVISGYLGQDIVYEKVVLTTGCSSLIANHLYVKYPVAQKKRYDPIVSRMAKSLQPSRRGSMC